MSCNFFLHLQISQSSVKDFLFMGLLPLDCDIEMNDRKLCKIGGCEQEMAQT